MGMVNNEEQNKNRKDFSIIIERLFTIYFSGCGFAPLRTRTVGGMRAGD